MFLKEEEVIQMFGGENSSKIYSAKTIAKYFKITKRKCQAFLYKNKKFHKVKQPYLVGSGTLRSSLWTLNKNLEN